MYIYNTVYVSNLQTNEHNDRITFTNCPIICFQLLIYVRIVFFGLIFICNAVMWTLFVKSLQKCSSSLEATVTNTAANFFFTVSSFNMLCKQIVYRLS